MDAHPRDDYATADVAFEMVSLGRTSRPSRLSNVPPPRVPGRKIPPLLEFPPLVQCYAIFYASLFLSLSLALSLSFFSPFNVGYLLNARVFLHVNSATGLIRIRVGQGADDFFATSVSVGTGSSVQQKMIQEQGHERCPLPIVCHIGFVSFATHAIGLPFPFLLFTLFLYL